MKKNPVLNTILLGGLLAVNALTSCSKKGSGGGDLPEPKQTVNGSILEYSFTANGNFGTDPTMAKSAAIRYTNGFGGGGIINLTRVPSGGNTTVDMNGVPATASSMPIDISGSSARVSDPAPVTITIVKGNTTYNLSATATTQAFYTNDKGITTYVASGGAAAFRNDANTTASYFKPTYSYNAY